MSDTPRCAVCPEPEAHARIFVGGEPMFVCTAHAELLGAQVFTEREAFAARLEALGLEPRKRRERRRGERRMFPRPEGRRLGDGRRADDTSG